MDGDLGRMPAGARRRPADDARRSPDCPRIEPLLPAFHDGALEGDQARFVRTHVATCASCQSRLAAYKGMDALMRDHPQPLPPVALREELFARIAAAPARSRPRLRARLHSLLLPRLPRKGALATATTEPTRRQRPQPQGVGRPPALIPGIAALTVAALLALAFATQARPHPAYTGLGGAQNGPATATQHAQQVQSVKTLRDLPRFADWHAAYLAADGRLHISSPDGGTVIGPALPAANQLVRSDSTLPYYDAVASPDGHYIAFTENGDMNTGVSVDLLDLMTGTTRDVAVHVRDLFWSPDSSQLAANMDGFNMPEVTLIDAHDGTVRSVVASQGSTPVGIGRILGWINSTKLGVLFAGGTALVPTASSGALSDTALSGGPARLLLGSLDVATGAVRTIGGVPQPADVVLTPDGQEALILSSYWNSTAEVMSLKDGTTRVAPSITKTFAPLLQHVNNVNFAQGGNWSLHHAWQPGAHVLAISLSVSDGRADESGVVARQQTGVWLVDLDRDSAIALDKDTYPLAWLPDGATLLVSDPPVSQFSPLAGAGVGQGLYALAPVTPGGVRRALANDLAVFLGLVRTK